jgi:hypothetical protein
MKNHPFRDPGWWLFILIFPAWSAIAWLNGDCTDDDGPECEYVEGLSKPICEEPDPLGY